MLSTKVGISDTASPWWWCFDPRHQVEEGPVFREQLWGREVKVRGMD